MSLIDNLKDQIPFLKTDQSPKYFLALNIGLSEVTAGVWSVKGDKLDLLSASTSPYEGLEDIIQKSNFALDEAVGISQFEPEKILFGVPESWVLDGDLKEQYGKLLKSLVKEFDLDPLAYLTTPQAISHLLQKEEGIPPSVLLLSIGNYVETTLLRGGKVIENRYSKRGDHLFDDISKLLGQFTEVEVMPSKILVYSDKSSEDLEKIKDELLTFPWMNKFPFLHLPKVDLLEKDLIPKALSYAGAVEVYPDIDLKHSFKIYKSSLRSDNLKSHSEGSKPFKSGKLSRLTPNKMELEVGQDSEDFPFIEERLPSLTQTVVDLENIGSKVKRYIKLPFKFGLLQSKAQKPLLIAAALLSLVLLFYLFILKATVAVFVEPRVLEKETTVIADPNLKEANIEGGIIPAQMVETTVQGTDKGNATGEKAIGNSAKGKVIIYNLSANKLSLSQGSTLVSENSLKFTLDTSVSIASQSSSVSSDFTTVLKPGKSDPISITAQAIGPDSNLPGGTQMQVTTLSKNQAIAKVDEALTGGTAKTVTVVTAEDQKKLQARVLEDLRQKAEVDLREKLTDKKIISEALTITSQKFSFNKSVGDQALEFNLSAIVHFKGTAYADADLRAIVAKLIQTDVPANYHLNLAESETQADIAKVEKDGKLQFKAKFRAKLIPKFDFEELKNRMRGKSIEAAILSLKELENVIDAGVVLSPNLPSPIGRIPILSRNIEITVSPK